MFFISAVIEQSHVEIYQRLCSFYSDFILNILYFQGTVGYNVTAAALPPVTVLLKGGKHSDLLLPRANSSPSSPLSLLHNQPSVRGFGWVLLLPPALL